MGAAQENCMSLAEATRCRRSHFVHSRTSRVLQNALTIKVARRDLASGGVRNA